MHKWILFATLLSIKPFQYKCEIKDTTTRVKAIIMPFETLKHNEFNYLDKITIYTDYIQNQNNIKAKKICLSIWLKKNNQEYFTNDEVLIVDQVHDVVTNKVSKLINPYILVIRQDEVLESYKLKHLTKVNAEVKEKVFNKELSTQYLGCYTDFKRSSCNKMMKASSSSTKQNPIKYSEGFCCSCKMELNIKRQLIDCEGRSRFKHVIHTTKSYREEVEMVINQMVDNITSENEKVSDNSSHIIQQIRGGQNCDDSKSPRYVDEPYRYHESSHCLQFSDLWYNVNKLESASYYHSITMSIYEKRTKDGKSTYKKIISKVKLSTKNKTYKNNDSTVQANYVSLTFGENQYYSLDIDRDRLLIPRKVSSVIEYLYPEATDDPRKYLIVNENNISIKGDECNKVGVSYEAFYKQNNRCGEPKSSCLKNQPSHLWRHDMEAMDSGNPGNYFLENFAKFPHNTDIIQENNGTETLNLLYEMDYTSELLIHTTTNYNNIISTKSLIEIVEVYSDATKSDLTTIVAAIYNIGMHINLFRVQLIKCPLNTSSNYTKIQGLELKIFPFHRYNYVLYLNGSLEKSNINCTLQVLDESDKVIAWRHILISEANRCFCVWKCECSCTTIEYQSFRSNCEIIAKEHYKGAGFRGALPPIPKENFRLNISNLIILFIETSWIIIFLTGILKAMIGQCFKSISLFGLDIIFHKKSKNLKIYMEPELYSECVMRDINGYAIHPITKKRTIRLVSKKAEIFTNIFFLSLILGFLLNKWCSERTNNIIRETSSIEDCSNSEDNIEIEDKFNKSRLYNDADSQINKHKKSELNDEFIDYQRLADISMVFSKIYKGHNEYLTNLPIHLMVFNLVIL